jgi:hypothetical protein
MARTTEHDSSAIFSTAAEWRDGCLIGGKSLLWEDRQIWSTANLLQFKSCFIDRPDTSKDKNFEQKFQAQLGAEGVGLIGVQRPELGEHAGILFAGL